MWSNLVRTRGYYKHRKDERSRLQRNHAMFSAWEVQMPALMDAYLEFKHPSTPSTYPVVHRFSVIVVDILGEALLHLFTFTMLMILERQHVLINQLPDELANCSLLHAGLLGTSPATPSVALTINCLELYHQIRRRQSSFSIQAMVKVLCTLHNVCGASNLLPASIYSNRVYRFHIPELFVTNSR
jgi:hypothetical protein